MPNRNLTLKLGLQVVILNICVNIFCSQGYTITTEKENADLWLLNSCTVKNPAEEHFKNEVKAGLEQNKKVVVAGCVPQV